jgi:HK97 family phage major capsid protein
MSHLDTLYGRRANLISEVRSLGLEAGPNMTGEQRQSTDRLSSELEKVGAEIRSIERGDARSVAASEVRAEFPHLQRSASGQGRGSELRGYLLGRDEGSFEIRFEQRDLLVGGSAGSATVPTTISWSVVNYLESVTPIRRVAQVFTTQAGEPLRLPTISAPGTATAVAEAGPFLENDPGLGYVELKAWKFGVLLQVSSELIADSTVAIDQIIGRYLGQALGRVTSPLYCLGAGTAGPQGYALDGLAAGTVLGGTGLAGAPSYAALIDTRFKLRPEFRDPAACAWLMSDSALAAIWKLTDIDGRPIYTPTITAGQPDMLLGSPLYVDNDLAAVALGARSVYFGNWGQGFAVRDVVGVRLDRSVDYAFANDLVTMRAQLRTDSRVTDPRAIACYKGGSA